MSELKVLNSREIKKIKNLFTAAFGRFLKNDYAYLISEKDKLFLVNKDISRIDLKKLKVDKIGLYFAEIKNGQARLSKEGAQLLYLETDGKLENIIELNEKEVKDYFAGLNLKKDLGEENNLVILKFKADILGCARYKEGKIINFLPKIHRGEVIL